MKSQPVNAAVRRGVCRDHPLCSFLFKNGKECDKRPLDHGLYCDMHSKPAVAPVVGRRTTCSGINAKGKACGARPTVERRGKWYCLTHVSQGGKEEVVVDKHESSEEEEDEEVDWERRDWSPVVEYEGKGWRKVECDGWLSKGERCGGVVVVAAGGGEAGWTCVLHERQEKKAVDEKAVVCGAKKEEVAEKVAEDRVEKCSGTNAKGKACGAQPSVERQGKWWCETHVGQEGKKEPMADEKRAVELKPSETKALKGRLIF